MNSLINDLRYAVRMLVKRPGGTIVATGTIALLIGTLSMGLGFAERERARWVPFPESENLVRLWRIGKGARPYDSFPREVLLALRDKCQGMELIGGMGGHRAVTLTGHGEPRRLTGIRVSANTLEASGILPQLGRIFSEAEERSAESPPVVLTHGTWQDVFDGDEKVIGSEILIDDVQYTVTAVMPAGANQNVLFFGLDLWLPGNFESPASEEPWVGIVGRLKPGVSRTRLNAELEVLARPVEEAYAAKHSLEGPVASVAAHPIKKTFGDIDADEVFFLAIVPLFVVLIASFNIATILLTRMIARRKEIAVRSSLGASRPRLIRQLLVESVVLAVVGGGFGLLGAMWISELMSATGTATRFSLHVMGIALGCSLVMGLFVGWIPALRATGGNLNEYLKDSPGGGGVERHRLRKFLVAGQVAIATMLCITTALFLRSYYNKKQFDPGFETARMIQLPISLRRDVYDTRDKRRLYAEEVLQRMRSLSGLEEVCVATSSPVNRLPFPMGIQFEDNFGKGAPQPRVHLTAVSPNYFQMFNVRLLRGRAIDESDRAGNDRVAVVNQTFVRQFFPDVDPIGRRIRVPLGDGAPWVTVVGVVPDQPNVGYKPDFGPEAFLAFDQTAAEWGSYFFLARARTDPVLFADALRECAKSVDANQPTSRPATLDSRLAQAVRRDVEMLRPLVAIGAFGLLMAVLGIYGVVANWIAERTREIGIRMALGADRSSTLALVLGQGMRLVGFGLVVGMILAGATTFAISQMLFGIGTLDPLTYVVVGMAMLLTALVASLVPAMHALRIDPMEALRHE